MTTLRRPEKISEWIAREIVRDIASRAVPTGTALPSESEMIGKYGVSRASVREALRILEVQGLIQLKTGPKGGPIVASVSSEDFGRSASLFFHISGATVRELLEARAIVEPLVTRIAATRPDALLGAQLKAIASEQRALPLDDHHGTMFSGRFHKLLAGSTGNIVLDLFASSLTDIYHQRVGALDLSPAMREQCRSEHGEIAAAVAAGNPDRAERLMRRHMRNLIAYLEQHHAAVLEATVSWG